MSTLIPTLTLRPSQSHYLAQAHTRVCTLHAHTHTHTRCAGMPTHTHTRRQTGSLAHIHTHTQARTHARAHAQQDAGYEGGRGRVGIHTASAVCTVWSSSKVILTPLQIVSSCSTHHCQQLTNSTYTRVYECFISANMCICACIFSVDKKNHMCLLGTNASTPYVHMYTNG